MSMHFMTPLSFFFGHRSMFGACAMILIVERTMIWSILRFGSEPLSKRLAGCLVPCAIYIHITDYCLFLCYLVVYSVCLINVSLCEQMSFKEALKDILSSENKLPSSCSLRIQAQIEGYGLMLRDVGFVYICRC